MYPNKFVVYILLAILLIGVISFKTVSPIMLVEAIPVHLSTSDEIDMSLMNTEKMLSELEEVSKSEFTIQNNMSLLTLTNYKAEEFDKMLKGTPMYGYGYALVKVEKLCGVNGLFLAGIAGQEQGFGTGLLAMEKNNLTSYGAYDGKEYKAITFESFEECLLVTAISLRRDYLTETGKYYGGLTVSGVNKSYASDGDWANNIIKIMKQLNRKLLE